MKIAILTILYKQIVDDFYRNHPTIQSMPFSEQKQKFDSHASLWATGWEQALKKCGHEILTITVNAHTVHNAWAHEHGFPSSDMNKIILEEVKQFKPEVLWYDYFDVRLIKEIKSSIQSLHLVLGWTGSAVASYEVFREMNLVLSCAPETVELLRKNGIVAYHLHHAFDPSINSFIHSGQKKYNITFVGQIVRGREFHTHREHLLKQLVAEVDVDIFSPAHLQGMKEILKTPILQAAYLLSRPLKWLGVTSQLNNVERFRKILELPELPKFPFDRKLKTKLQPPVFGLTMYQTLADSYIVLNIHADSSPLYASNMRLFETTGVGTCLMTDWKKNIDELFTDEKEIMTYRSSDECVEKLIWLLRHPTEAAELGSRGQQRTLQCHTYDVRSRQLLDIIRRSLS